MTSASLCISSSKFRIVTLAVIMAMGMLLSPAIAAGVDSEIEAKAYDVKTVRPSKSGRVYLFEKPEAGLPVDGKLFLVREGDTPVMAMRVLKTYAIKNRIAAKKLKTYPGFEVLERGSQYRAFEKVGNSVLPVPMTSEDLHDLKELEALESAEITPPPEAASDEIDYYFPNEFTMATGFVGDSKIPGAEFSGGLLYGRHFSPDLVFETGFYYYRASGPVEDVGDVTLTVVPVVGQLRIQKQYGNLWTLYGYGGFLYPFVASQIGATNTYLRQIQVISPALGVGAFLQTGPNWYLRLNLGIESIALGVMLRY